ncbi:MAG: pentapeptide repeat-containing protein [Patescibacteria group bacterium]
MDIFGSSSSLTNQLFESLNGEHNVLSEKDFEQCTFRKCSFVNSSFTKCRFIDCKFIECTLSAIKLTNSSIIDPKFIDSKVIGIDWTLLKTFNFPQFITSQLDYCNFRFTKIPKTTMTDCVVHEADFTECDLHESDFSRTDFAGTVFFKTNVSKSSFVGAFNYSIDARANNIKKAHFSLPEAASLLRSLEIVIE